MTTGADTNADAIPQPTGLPTTSRAALPDWPVWLPYAAAGLFAALIAAWLLLRRRRRRAILALPAPATAPVPAPPAMPPRPAAAARPPAPQAATGRRADLSVRLEPLSASSTLVNFRMRYAVIVSNAGPVAAADLRLRIGLFAGTQASERGVAQWLKLGEQAPHHSAPDVPAYGEYRFEGELAAPLDALGAMTVDGRQLAIALVALDLRYHNAQGAAVLDGQTARAFVVGREPPPSNGAPSPKLAPFRIDQGPTSFAPLGVRDTGISHVA